jgi:hypothetical protein
LRYSRPSQFGSTNRIFNGRRIPANSIAPTPRRGIPLADPGKLNGAKKAPKARLSSGGAAFSRAWTHYINAQFGGPLSGVGTICGGAAGRGGGIVVRRGSSTTWSLHFQLNFRKSPFQSLLEMPQSSWQTEGPMVLKLRLLGIFCLLVSLLILIAAPAAHAVYRSPKNICKHISDCLLRTSEPNNNDAVRIREGVRTRNGEMVWADACAVALKIKRNGTNGRLGAQTLSMSQLLRQKSKTEKPCATGIHNSAGLIPLLSAAA